MENQLSLRVNCIGITYKTGRIQKWHFKHIIEDVFEVPDELVAGIDDRCPTRWLFEVKTKECYKYICDKFSGREISINNNCIVQVDDISYPGTRVELSNVPFSITNDQLTGMMQNFGVIHKTQSYFKIFGKYDNLTKSGDRVMWISIHEHIPQSLYISKTDINIDVYYHRQPMTCNMCGNIGHPGRFCKCKSGDHINIININDSHTGVSEVNLEETEAHPEAHNASTDSVDVYIDPSQNNNEYKCKKCEYKCTYIDIFKTHLLTHTGESTVGDLTGEEPSESDISDLINNARATIGVNTHVCTTCEFTCSNKSELCKHLKTHNIYACEKCDYTNNSLHGLNSHSKKHNDKRFDCTVCAFKGTSVNSLNAHMKTHIGDNINDASQRNKRDYSISPEANKNTRLNKAQKLQQN